MSDWIDVLDGFLKLFKHEILIHAGRISTKAAEPKAMEEYKKFKMMFQRPKKVILRDLLKIWK